MRVCSSSLLAWRGEAASTGIVTHNVFFVPCLLGHLLFSGGSLSWVGPGSPHSSLTDRAPVSCETWVQQSPGPSQARRGQGSAPPGVSPFPGAVVAGGEGVTCMAPTLAHAHRKHTLKLLEPSSDMTPPTQSLRRASSSVRLSSVQPLPTSLSTHCVSGTSSSQ